MGSTGAVPGAEAGGDRGVRDGVVSQFCETWGRYITLIVRRVCVRVCAYVCGEHGNKESDGTDGAIQGSSRTVPQSNKRRKKVPALR